MCVRKHTVTLQDSGHENDTNILAVLTESHTRGRYSIRPFLHGPQAQLREGYRHLLHERKHCSGGYLRLCPSLWERWR
jgi:hypothetical protein